MIRNWFETKISYEKEIEGGMIKKVAEYYLIDALSFTEAEARIIKEMTPFITGEFCVANIKRANYSELICNEDGDRYYACKVEFVHLDEKSGAEKRTASNILVKALDIDDAKTFLQDGMKGTLSDYEVVAIKETKLMGVFIYDREQA